MRNAAIIIAFFVSLAVSAQQSTGDLTIELHRAGPVTIGADAQEVYASFPRDRRKLIDLELEGHLSPALALSVIGSDMPDGLIAELWIWGNGMGLVVNRIQVRDPILRTREGIGVGSTIGELRGAYDISGVLTGEGHLFVRVEELSASFELDWSDYGFDRTRQFRDPGSIPADLEIVSILVTRNPRLSVR